MAVVNDMTKTERLLQLLQILRSYRHPVTAQRLSERLGVSIRTLYRDIATLQRQGAEIMGEAGIGYILKPSFFLPPLMFSQTEIEALLLGAQWVAQFGDAPLSQGSETALAKITAVLPARIKHAMNSYTLRVGPSASESMRTEDLTRLRDAIAHERKILLFYDAEPGSIVWPFTIGYFTTSRILVGWSEHSNQYKHYETDKIISFEILDHRYPRSKNSLFLEWQDKQFKTIS